MQPDRRNFLISAGAGLGTAWLSVNWPAALAASAHARVASASDVLPKLEFFTAEQATEVAAISARIIPSGDTPGATEAGAVYFIDRALRSFAADTQSIYSEGLAAFQEDFHTAFPSAGKFSAASAEQQDQFLHAQDSPTPTVGRRRSAPAGTPTFFETIRTHTIAAFLIDPESEHAGNRSGVGWQVIGRESAHSFQSPFGFYDKNYRGWSSASSAEKAK
jgi:hypothetical protein